MADTPEIGQEIVGRSGPAVGHGNRLGKILVRPWLCMIEGTHLAHSPEEGQDSAWGSRSQFRPRSRLRETLETGLAVYARKDQNVPLSTDTHEMGVRERREARSMMGHGSSLGETLYAALAAFVRSD